MLHRRPLVQSLLDDRPDDLLVVSGLGSSTWDVAAAGDDPRNFQFIGAMGQAAPFAFGLAMAQPDKRVLLITGDGELLMALGMLATIANHAVTNLAMAVLDNEAYVETGQQPTATAGATELSAVAKACGFQKVTTVREQSEVAGLREFLLNEPGPVFATVKIVNEAPPLKFPHSFDGAVAFNRFQDAISGRSTD